MSSNAAFQNVQRGGLKLKPKAAAALVRAVAAAPPVAGVGAQVSGAKRRVADISREGTSAAAAAVAAAAAAAADADVPSATLPSAAAVAVAAASLSSTASSATAPAPAPAVLDRRTPAQRAHDEALARRRDELANKAASKSHRQRVDELNHLLATAPEHFDLPRISFAGQG